MTDTVEALVRQAVREPFDRAPVDAILRRGQTIRARRFATASAAAMVSLIAVGVLAPSFWEQGVRFQPASPAPSAPADGETQPVALGPFVWESSSSGSPVEAGEEFSRDVLDWPAASVESEPAAGGPTWLTITQDDRTVKMMVVPTSEGGIYRAMQVGSATLDLRAGSDALFFRGAPASAVGGEVYLDGETHPTASMETADLSRGVVDLPPGSVDLESSVVRPSSAIVLFRDREGNVIDAAGGHF